MLKSSPVQLERIRTSQKIGSTLNLFVDFTDRRIIFQIIPMPFFSYRRLADIEIIQCSCYSFIIDTRVHDNGSIL